MPTAIRDLPTYELAAVLGSNEDWLDEIVFTQDDNVTPWDLTGIAFRARVRPSPDAREAWPELSTAAGTLVNGGATGKLSFRLLVAARAPIHPGSYVLDVLAEADGYTRAVVVLGAAQAANLTVRKGIA